jgi:hypothetical protein
MGEPPRGCALEGDMEWSERPCKHETVIGSAGLKVCFDCGAPMNSLARKLAERKR